MTYECLKVTRHDSTEVVELHRPERMNALSLAQLDELQEELARVDEDSEVRVVILAGSERAFSTGVDLNEALEASGIGESLRYLARFRRINTAIETLSKPVLAAIRGYCLTGGLELAMACDLRFASEDAQFGVTSSRIGSVAGMGGTQRLPRLVGPSRAKDLLMTARFIGAREALEIGLVDRVVPAEQLLEEALAWAALCAERAPLSVWLAKYAVNVGLNLDLRSALDLEALLTTLAFGTEDKAEGMRAFLEKRPPQFRGR
jgi:enoyl-CoA hydratase/carnithine racemase